MWVVHHWDLRADWEPPLAGCHAQDREKGSYHLSPPRKIPTFKICCTVSPECVSFLYRHKVENYELNYCKEGTVCVK